MQTKTQNYRLMERSSHRSPSLAAVFCVPFPGSLLPADSLPLPATGPPPLTAPPPAPPPPCPIVCLTCGDPAGIGPEVVLAAWSRSVAHARARLRVVARPELLDEVLRTVPALPRLTVERVAADDPRPSTVGTVLAIDPGGSGETVPRGLISAAGGRAAVGALELAFRIVRDAGPHAALVTGPLHKAALHAAGHDLPGHTEWLARACGLPDAAASMMLWLPPLSGAPAAGTIPGGRGLGVVHVTLHEALANAVGRLSTAGIVAAGERLAPLLAALLGRRPRIGVAALNPHGGEGGLFGEEEGRIIIPAVAALRAAGIDADGPFPADTLFLRAAHGGFDGIVAQYHDQGHIAVKLLGMHRAVNITLGLPIVRTSVAHGTAFDIVGRGAADPTSLEAAIDAAVRLVEAGWIGSG